MVYKFFYNKRGANVKYLNENEQIPDELHKPVTKKLKKNIYARFKDNIWAADLTEMESMYCKNKNINISLCVIDVFTKYAWVKPIKDKKGETVSNGFIEIVNESHRKPKKSRNRIF